MRLEREERGRAVRVQKRPGSVCKVVSMPPEYFLMILVKCKGPNLAVSICSLFPFAPHQMSSASAAGEPGPISPALDFVAGTVAGELLLLSSFLSSPLPTPFPSSSPL